MGYREVIVRSKTMSLEKLADNINRRKDSSLVDDLKSVATVKKDFTCDKIRMFGQEKSIKPIELKAGEQYLVVTGEGDAVNKVINKVRATEVYQLDNIFCSVKCIEGNIGYEDIFEDKDISTLVQGKEKKSVIEKLNDFKEKIEQNLKEHGDIESSKDVMKEDKEPER